MRTAASNLISIQKCTIELRTAGGTISCNKYSLVSFQGKVKVELTNNAAKDGEAIIIRQSTRKLKTGLLIRFSDNSATSHTSRR